MILTGSRAYVWYTTAFSRLKSCVTRGGTLRVSTELNPQYIPLLLTTQKLGL